MSEENKELPVVPAKNADQPVAVIVKRRIKPHQAAAFKTTVSEATEAVRSFPGFQGSDVLRPPAGDDADGDWGLILHFDSEANLKKWEDSPESKRWLERADELSFNAPDVERVNGLEAWFGLPSRKSAPAPPKWKTAVVSAVGIYPMISLMPGVIAPVTAPLPKWAANLVTVGVMMPLMTWIVMPIVTWAFKWWLFPANSKKNSIKTSNAA